MSRKSRKSTHTEYISTKHAHNESVFRLSNWFVLLSMVLLDRYLDAALPEAGYLIVISAIVITDFNSVIRSIRKKL